MCVQANGFVVGKSSKSLFSQPMNEEMISERVEAEKGKGQEVELKGLPGLESMSSRAESDKLRSIIGKQKLASTPRVKQFVDQKGEEEPVHRSKRIHSTRINSLQQNRKEQKENS